jgi:hypothetical protein
MSNLTPFEYTSPDAEAAVEVEAEAVVEVSVDDFKLDESIVEVAVEEVVTEITEVVAEPTTGMETVEEEVETPLEQLDPVAEFIESMKAKEGDWYVFHRIQLRASIDAIVSNKKGACAPFLYLSHS